MASALEFIEHVRANAGKVQRRVLAEILSQNAPAEYLRHYSVPGGSADAVEAFRRVVPLVTYEGLQPDILRIANGDTSPILSGKPVSEFLTRYMYIHLTMHHDAAVAGHGNMY